jgi:hypothetical protein
MALMERSKGQRKRAWCHEKAMEVIVKKLKVVAQYLVYAMRHNCEQSAMRNYGGTLCVFCQKAHPG